MYVFKKKSVRDSSSFA